MELLKKGVVTKVLLQLFFPNKQSHDLLVNGVQKPSVQNN